jgi:hypothetical protein
MVIGTQQQHGLWRDPHALPTIHASCFMPHAYHEPITFTSPLFDSLSLRVESPNERNSNMSCVESLPLRKPSNSSINSSVMVIGTQQQQHGGKV